MNGGEPIQAHLEDLARTVGRSDLIPSEKFCKKTLDAMPVLVVELPSKIIVYTTQLVEEIFGMECIGELIGKPLSILVHPDKREIHDKHLDMYYQHPMRRAMGTLNMPLEGYHRKGYVFPLQIGLNPYMDDGKTFIVASIAQVRLDDRRECP